MKISKSTRNSKLVNKGLLRVKSKPLYKRIKCAACQRNKCPDEMILLAPRNVYTLGMHCNIGLTS